MEERLSPKEIARIKIGRRNARIRHIRQVVATGAVTLVALFSGVFLTRSVISQSGGGAQGQATLTQATFTGENDDQSEETESMVGTSDSASAPSVPSTPTPTPVVTSQS